MTILLLNQYYTPDVASTAQHAEDMTQALVAHGHSVTVLTSRRDSNGVLGDRAGHEMINGVEVFRVGNTGFGKGSRWRRAADFGSFFAACTWRVLQMPRYDVVVAMTTPPLIGVLAAAITHLKGGEAHVWLMDMNPDEAIAAGWLRPDSTISRILESLNRFSLRSAQCVIVLDRFMQQRVEGKGIPRAHVEVVPPWAHDVVRWIPPVARSLGRNMVWGESS